MVKNNVDKEREKNMLPLLHELLFTVFYPYKASVTPVVEDWLDLEIAQWVYQG